MLVQPFTRIVVTGMTLFRKPYPHSRISSLLLSGLEEPGPEMYSSYSHVQSWGLAGIALAPCVGQSDGRSSVE